MGYIGRGPVKSGAFRIIDDISSSFNGSTTAFTLQSSSSNITPGTEQNLLVAVDGVMQEPQDAFTISGSTLTFTSAPASGASFWGVELGDVGGIATIVSNGAIDTSQLATDAVDGTKLADDSINSEHYADGSIDTAHIAASQITNALMADNAIDSIELVAGSVDLAHMSVNSIDSDQYVDGSIDTAHIGDNQVTGTKIAMGSDAEGDILYYDGTNYVRLAKGTADHILTMNDGATAPGWEANSASTVTLSGTTNNTVVTVTGSNAILGEANLTFNGSTLALDSANAAANSLSVRNSTNSSSASASLALSISGSSSGDAYVSFTEEVGGGQDWSLGLDTSDSKFKICKNGNLSLGDALVITDTGEITMPSQPAIFVRRGAAADNVTGNGTLYTMVFTSEIFDQNADFDATSTFTAPVTGRYHVDVYIDIASMTSSTYAIQLSVIMSNRTLEVNTLPMVANPARYAAMVSMLFDMDAADTLQIKLNVSGESGDIVDINSNTSLGIYLAA